MPVSRFKNKQILIQELSVLVRMVSAKSVLFSQTIAEIVGIHSTDMECLDFLLVHGPSTAGSWQN